MRKKLLALLSFACVAAAAISFAACEKPDSGNVGPEEPPIIDLIDSDAPVDIMLHFDSTAIYVDYAVYDSEGTPSPYSEYKLDDGEWCSVQEGDYDVVYENLTPGSLHTVYARCGEHEGYRASAEYSVNVTLDKTYRNERFESAEYDVTGRTLTVELGDELEVSFDNRETFTTDGTYTYDTTGTKTFYIRYRETDMYYAESAKSFTVKITDFAGGLGTEEKPYLIDSYERFKVLQTETNLRERDWCKLTDDIIFDDEIWDGISFNEYINIDGGGHKIIAPKLAAPLFDKIGTAKDLTVEQAEYTANLAGLETNAALLSGWIQRAYNVAVSGTITLTCDEMPSYSRDYPVSVGGIAVNLSQPFSVDSWYGMDNCRADITVSLPDTDDGAMVYNLALGGLVAAVIRCTGSDAAEITACKANLNVYGGEIEYGDIGGLVGALVASGESGPTDRAAPPIAVSDSYTTGSVALKVGGYRANKQIRIGGIAPAVRGSIERCYSTIAFDITADVRSDDTEILIGGIVAKGESEGILYPVLTNVFFAGSITVKNIAEESKRAGFFSIGIICVQAADFDSKAGRYYDEATLLYPEGAEQVGASALDDAVASAELRSEGWQRSILAWDEDIWSFKDGELPVLKFF